MLSMASSAYSAKQAEEQADRQEDLAKRQARFERAVALRRQEELAEAAAEEQLVLAEEAARARGVAQAQVAPGGSFRSFLTHVERQQGRSSAIIDRNVELARRGTADQLRASQLSLSGKLLAIDAGRPDAVALALQLTSIGLGAGSGMASNSLGFEGFGSQRQNTGFTTATGGPNAGAAPNIA